MQHMRAISIVRSARITPTSTQVGSLALTKHVQTLTPWYGRLAPKQIAILGGEPTLNPELLQIIELARRAFPDSPGLL